jgi:anaerobic magnesium-protoporphyrin IX monomethyl ester cyclase
MSLILFTHSYFYRFDPKQWKAAQPCPPYGTMSAATWLRESGVNVIECK